MSFGVVQFRRGTAAQGAAANPVLNLGELAYETDTAKFKIGDGVTAWNSLPYGGIKGDTGNTGLTGSTGPTGNTGATGDKGWSPILAVVTDSARRVLQIVDWTGGTGTKPSTTNQFIGASGIVASAALAVDVRGAPGVDGVTPNAFTTVTGTTGSAVADNANDTLAITGGTGISTAATDTPDGLVITNTNTGTAAVSTHEAAGDPHAQYLNNTRGDVRYTPIAHVGSGGTAHSVSTNALAGFMAPSDKGQLEAFDMGFVVLTDRRFTGGTDIRSGGNSATVRSALDAAIAALPAAGGMVFVPPGTYNLGSSAYSINKAHVRIVGAARWNTKFTTDSATADLFVVNEWFIQFEDLTFTTNVVKSAGYAINSGPTFSYGRIRRCNVTGSASVTMFNGFRASATLMNVEESEMRFFTNFGIMIDGNSDHQIKGVVTDNVVQAAAGIRVENTASLVIGDCNIIHSGVALDVAPGVGITVPSMKVYESFFDTSTIGLRIGGAGSVFRSSFVGCWFSSHTTYGVHLNNALASGIDFQSCDMYSNAVPGGQQQYGIYAQACKDWSATHCRMAGHTTAAIGTVAQADAEFRILDNFLGATSAFPANAAAVIVGAGNYTSYSVVGNDCTGNTNRPIQDNGTGTVGKQVFDNVPGPMSGAIGQSAGPVAGVSQTGEQIMLNVLVPAYTLRVGSIIRVRGFFTNAAVASNPTIRVRIGSGAGTITDALAVAVGPITVAASGGYSAEFMLVVRSATQITGSATGYGPAVAVSTAAQGLVATPTIDAALRILLTVSLSAATVPTMQSALVELPVP